MIALDPSESDLPIPVNVPEITTADMEAVQAALSTGWVSGDGPFIGAFETDFARVVETPYAAAVSSGSAALDIAIGALELEPGDEVILPTLSIISCLSPLLRARLTPVFVDARPDDWNMDTAAATSAITPRTRAIIAVHTYGLAVDMNPLMLASERHGIPVIEDAAEVLGVRYRGRPCGGLGTIGVYSLYANKVVTSGEGGMLTTSNQSLDETFRLLRNLAFRPGDRFVHDRLGWNYRLSSMQAALGQSQLRSLDRYREHKRLIAARYRELLADTPGLTWQPESNGYSENGYWVVGVVFDSQAYGPVEPIRQALAALSVGTRRFFHPMHRQPVLDRYGHGYQPAMPVADSLFAQGCYLPSGTGMPLAHVDVVCERLRAVLTSVQR